MYSFITISNKTNYNYNNQNGFTYWDRITNIWVREKTKVTDVTEQVRSRNGPGQGTSSRYEITEGHCVSPPGHHTKGKDLE